MNTEDRIGCIGVAVHRYLAAHPAAADSAVGIRHWWLSELDFDASAAELQLALDRLVARGELRIKLLAGGIKLYST